MYNSFVTRATSQTVAYLASQVGYSGILVTGMCE